MDNIIKELVKIESLAKAVTEKTETDKNNLSKRIAVKAKEIENQIEAETKAAIKKLHEQAVDETRARVLQISIDNQKQYASLEKGYEKHHQAWADEIVDHIIGR